MHGYTLQFWVSTNNPEIVYWIQLVSVKRELCFLVLLQTESLGITQDRKVMLRHQAWGKENRETGRGWNNEDEDLSSPEKRQSPELPCPKGVQTAP